MKRFLYFVFGFVAFWFLMSLILDQSYGQNVEIRRGGGAGGALTGSYSFNANQFTVVGSTAIVISANAPVTNAILKNASGNVATFTNTSFVYVNSATGDDSKAL